MHQISFDVFMENDMITILFFKNSSFKLYIIVSFTAHKWNVLSLVRVNTINGCASIIWINSNTFNNYRLRNIHFPF